MRIVYVTTQLHHEYMYDPTSITKAQSKFYVLDRFWHSIPVGYMSEQTALHSRQLYWTVLQ